MISSSSSSPYHYCCQLRTTMSAPAHFFKYIPPGLIFDRELMSIPESFRKYLKSTWKNKNAILTRGCHKWPVMIENDWAFGQGWKDFVRENGVQDCDIVVFQYQGNMIFEIMVFDLNWCEKEYPTHDHVTENKAEKAECSEATSSGKSQFDTSTLNETTKENETCRNNSTESLLKAEKRTSPDDNQHPYFTATLKSEYILNLPTSFSRQNGLRVGKMILRNSQTQKSWTVELNICSGDFYRIGRGWHDFYIVNGLKKGDNFKLELIKNGIKPEAKFYRISGLPKETIKEKVVQNPYFKSIVTSFGIDHSYLNVPMKFARSNGLLNKNCESVVMDEKRRLWPTKICSTNERVRIRRFRDIWAANGLEEGDEFFLELVENGTKPLINLHVNHPLTKMPMEPTI